jgi:hypothetical protein
MTKHQKIQNVRNLEFLAMTCVKNSDITNQPNLPVKVMNSVIDAESEKEKHTAEILFNSYLLECLILDAGRASNP